MSLAVSSVTEPGLCTKPSLWGKTPFSLQSLWHWNLQLWNVIHTLLGFCQSQLYKVANLNLKLRLRIHNSNHTWLISGGGRYSSTPPWPWPFLQAAGQAKCNVPWSIRLTTHSILRDMKVLKLGSSAGYNEGSQLHILDVSSTAWQEPFEEQKQHLRHRTLMGPLNPLQKSIYRCSLSYNPSLSGFVQKNGSKLQ